MYNFFAVFTLWSVVSSSLNAKKVEIGSVDVGHWTTVITVADTVYLQAVTALQA
jgi:hypothetical protein